MKFSFFLSTKGGSPLQVGLERGLLTLGHKVTYFKNGDAHAFDALVVFNQCAHDRDYAYPDFPTYKVPILFVDTAEYGYHKRLPEVIRDYCYAFAPGSMSHDTKNLHEQTRLKQFLEGKSYPYFLREYSKHMTFPLGYYPIDYPLYALSACREKPNREQYLRRSQDLFLSWGASHPWRWDVTRALRLHPCKSEVLVIEENGTPRMDQGLYFSRLSNAKCSASFDGYGSSSFRVTETLVRTLLLIGPLSIHVRQPLVDGKTCIEYDMETRGEEFISTNVADKLREALADPERSFRIYEAGYDWTMAHYTETATARYLVDTMTKHDWSRPAESPL